MASLLNNPDVLALIAALAAVGVLGLVWQALMINDPMPARLKALSRRRDEIRADMAASKTRRGKINQQAMMKQVVDALKLANSSKAQNMRTLLMQAGYRSRDALTSFLFAKMALGLGLAAGLFFLVTLHLLPIKENFSVLSSLCGGFLGWILPDILVKNTAQKRAEAMRKALPDALDLMVICAEAGLSVDATFERVAREMAGASAIMAEELGLTVVELNLLPERSRALYNLTERVNLQGIKNLVNTLIQTEKYGTPLAQALRVLSAEMREERMMKAEEKAAALPAKLTVPMILFILPTLFMVLLGPAIIRVMDTMAKGG